MALNVHILGCGSATPTLRHMPSCQVVECAGALYMIDCGEGAQLSMRRQGLPMSRLRHIFISHMHGDHVLGLPGLLASMTLLDIKGDVHVHMPAEGVDMLRMVLATCAHEPGFNLVIHPLTPKRALVHEDKRLTVETFALCHRVPAIGYILRERQKAPHLRSDMLEFFQVPVRDRAALKAGADFVTADGRVIPNSRFVRPAEPADSYAYCSDTIYNPGVALAVQGVRTLYHEATYADADADKAAKHGHSTAAQAGRVAREAGVERLVIGHFSQKYAGHEDVLLQQARREFPNTILANEGLVIS